jgi:alkanesulfonate monooxygenase SsuD/methylene tetrahydromethanopterin reductase-like flavin-dependent oxidoreductase (luciferase family)
MQLLAEQVEIVHRQLSGEIFSFHGEHYELDDCVPLPPPVQRPRPPIVIGGRGGAGTIGPAVRFADEYNTFFASVEECRELRAKLDAACEREGRDPRSLPLSLMTGCVVGSDDAEVRQRLRRRIERSGSRERPEAFRRRVGDHFVLGTMEEAAERLHALEDAGIQRAMLQHLDHTDVEMVALIGRELAPAVA